jgi:hypothetical protein
VAADEAISQIRASFVVWASSRFREASRLGPGFNHFEKNSWLTAAIAGFYFILNEFNLLASLNLLETIFSPLVKAAEAGHCPADVFEPALVERQRRRLVFLVGFPADSGRPADYGLIFILSAERACG